MLFQPLPCTHGHVGISLWEHQGYRGRAQATLQELRCTAAPCQQPRAQAELQWGLNVV